MKVGEKEELREDGRMLRQLDDRKINGILGRTERMSRRWEAHGGRNGLL